MYLILYNSEKKMLRVIMIMVMLIVGAETADAQGLRSIFKSVTNIGSGVVVPWNNPNEMEPEEYIRRYFTKVAAISNAKGTEAYRIHCNSVQCRVEYTTDRAARIAYRRFVSMLSSEKRGVFKKRDVLTIHSCNIIDSNDSPECESYIYTPEKEPSGRILREQLQTLSQGWSSYVVVKLIDDKYWRVSTPLMKAHFTPIESEAYYAFDELDELAVAAQKVGLNMIFELDLRESLQFENASGHPVESQVGEMVVSKIIENMLQNISVAKIRLILPQSRYTARISDIKDNRFELILI